VLPPQRPRHSAAGRQQAGPTPGGHAADEDWPVDPGRPLGLRLLALLGALSFLMLGLSVVAPLLNPRPPLPPPPRGLSSATT